MALGNIKKRKTKGDFIKDPFNYVMVPAVARKLHARLLENFKHAEKISETSAYNCITGSGNLGIICNGVSYNYVYDAVRDLDMGDKNKKNFCGI